MTTSLMIWIHIVTASAAVIVGSLQLYGKKGTLWHKVQGWLWVVVMMVVALSSFFIRELREDGSMSWIHVLSVWTITSLVLAIVAIKHRRVTLHKHAMVGTFIGLVTAGIFALSPDRFLSMTFFAMP